MHVCNHNCCEFMGAIALSCSDYTVTFSVFTFAASFHAGGEITGHCFLVIPTSVKKLLSALCPSAGISFIFFLAHFLKYNLKMPLLFLRSYSECILYYSWWTLDGLACSRVCQGLDITHLSILPWSFVQETILFLSSPALTLGFFRLSFNSGHFCCHLFFYTWE